MRNLNNFRQEVESQKSWKLMGFCPKNTLLQIKHYVQDLSNITSNYLCKYSPNYLCHFWNNKSFFTTQLFYIILAQTLHTFDKSSPSKCKFSDFSILKLKFTKFLMSFFKSKVSFSSKFRSFLRVMRDNSSKLCMTLIKVARQSEEFQTCHCSH